MDVIIRSYNNLPGSEVKRATSSLSHHGSGVALTLASSRELEPEDTWCTELYEAPDTVGTLDYGGLGNDDIRVIVVE